tara:strand:+ start:6369 stop:7046 length:678 start_codon:yes stop_codon:yes gene_type:complete
MKTFKLSNPIIKSDVIDDTFTGENTMDVAKSAFKVLAKYMVTTKKNRFLFTMKDMNTNKEYHFDGNKRIVKKGKAVLNIKKFNIKKTGGSKISDHLTQAGGARKRKVRRTSSSISDDLLKELSIDSDSNSSELSEKSSSDQLEELSIDSSGGADKSKSSKSEDKKREEWLRRRYLFPANTYFFYDPVYYYLPSYTSYIFDRNVFIPNLYYSLYPYWSTIIPWIGP